MTGPVPYGTPSKLTGVDFKPIGFELGGGCVGGCGCCPGAIAKGVRYTFNRPVVPKSPKGVPVLKSCVSVMSLNFKSRSTCETPIFLPRY